MIDGGLDSASRPGLTGIRRARSRTGPDHAVVVLEEDLDGDGAAAEVGALGADVGGG